MSDVFGSHLLGPSGQDVLCNSKKDAAKIGFDDAFIYEELDLKPEDRRLKSEVLLPEEAIKAFQDWENKTDKVEY